MLSTSPISLSSDSGDSKDFRPNIGHTFHRMGIDSFPMRYFQIRFIYEWTRKANESSISKIEIRDLSEPGLGYRKRRAFI